MKDDSVVIVGMARTALGAFGGVFADTAVADLGAAAIVKALADAGVPTEEVEEVLMGCVLPAGVGQAPARQAALRAGLPNSVSCTTVNKVCGSGMKSVQMALNSILCAERNIVVAGGMENMSRAPHLLLKSRRGYRLGSGELVDHMYLDGLQDAQSGKLMGRFAEATAEKYSLSRQQQDAFARESLLRAQAAQREGRFRKEIAPLQVKDALIDADENPAKLNADKIPTLKPVFKSDGTVTAANASSIADGAAALVLSSERYARSKGYPILAYIDGIAEHACEPEWFTTAPISAMRTLLAARGTDVDKIDVFEINEAFAVVPLAAMRELNIAREKINVNGGACALGHPLGASGARIIVGLISAMEQCRATTGVASLCIGGGEAIALQLHRQEGAQ